MKNLTKFGIVLVALTMVTSAAFATNVYEGPDDDTWFDTDNWSDDVLLLEYFMVLDTDGVTGIPGPDETTQIKNGLGVIIDQTDAVLGTLDLRDGSLQVDTATVRADLTTNVLKSATDSGSNFFSLNILNGDVLWNQNGSARFSTQDVGEVIVNISGENIEFRNAAQILDISVADTGYFECTNLRPGGAEGEGNLDVDGVGTYARVSGDLFMGSGTISITNGAVLDLNRLRLGNDGDAYMIAATTDRDISIGEYIQMGTDLGNDSQLTIDDIRLDCPASIITSLRRQFFLPFLHNTSP